jgi:hypothetical protein
MSLTVHNVEYPKVACPLVRVAVKNPIIDNENLPGLMGGQGISTSKTRVQSTKPCHSIVFDVIVGAWSGSAQQCHESVVHVQLLVAVKQ